jgi:hypothetical protein
MLYKIIWRDVLRNKTKKYFEVLLLSHTTVGTATRYGLDGPGSNPSGNETLFVRPDRPWGPPTMPSGSLPRGGG